MICVLYSARSDVVHRIQLYTTVQQPTSDLQHARAHAIEILMTCDAARRHHCTFKYRSERHRGTVAHGGRRRLKKLSCCSRRTRSSNWPAILSISTRVPSATIHHWGTLAILLAHLWIPHPSALDALITNVSTICISRAAARLRCRWEFSKLFPEPRLTEHGAHFHHQSVHSVAKSTALFYPYSCCAAQRCTIHSTAGRMDACSHGRFTVSPHKDGNLPSWKNCDRGL